MSLSDERLEEIVKEQLFFEKSGDTSMWPSAYYDMARELQSLRASQAKVVEENARYRHLLDECADELENTRNQSGLIADVRAALAEHGGQT